MARARSTRASAQTWGVVVETIVSSMASSGTMEERPSEHSSTRSPRATSTVKWSARMVRSLPRARVMIERLGWIRASSRVGLSPAATSSST